MSQGCEILFGCSDYRKTSIRAGTEGYDPKLPKSRGVEVAILARITFSAKKAISVKGQFGGVPGLQLLWEVPNPLLYPEKGRLHQFWEVWFRTLRAEIFSQIKVLVHEFWQAKGAKCWNCKFRKISGSVIFEAFKLKIHLSSGILPKSLHINFKPIWISLAKINFPDPLKKPLFAILPAQIELTSWSQN